MASDAFDFFLQTGKLLSGISERQLPELNDKWLQNIKHSRHLFHSDAISFGVYTRDTHAKGFLETDEIIVIKIGRCYPSLDFSTKSRQESEFSALELAAHYKEYKASFAEFIKGIFVLVIYDKINKSLFALSGKSGLLKLYYHFSNESLLLSTNLDTIAKHPALKTELNPIALIEQLKFGYPLSNLTLIKDISILDNHSFLTYDNKTAKLSITEYYSFADKLRESGTLSWSETYRQTPAIFNSIMDQYLQGGEPLNSALTGGFDSRTILSSTFKHKDRIQYFSYGAVKSSDDIRIPQTIAGKLSLNYRWIRLGKEFLADYDYYANQLLYFSDGSGNLKRCNQMYSQSLLSNNSGVCITGCMGSELLRPNNMMSTNISSEMARLIYQDNHSRKTVSEVMATCPEMLQPEMFAKYKDEAIQHAFDNLKSVMLFDKAYLNLYHFTIRYSLWKFFGQEFHASRIYSILLSPYIDDDFVEFILKTPVPSLNKHAFRRNAADLRKGQLFYTPVLKQNLPELMHMETGRGYSPAQLESPLYPLNIILPFAIRRIHNTYFRRKTAFNAVEWNKISYKANPPVFTHSDGLFRELNPNHVKDNEYSLKKWAMDYL
jgi:hypothetical protein